MNNCNEDIHYHLHEEDGLLICPFCGKTIGDFNQNENMKNVKI